MAVLDSPCCRSEIFSNGTGTISIWISIRSSRGPDILFRYFCTCPGLQTHGFVARQKQEERFSGYPGTYCNAQMTSKQLSSFAQPDFLFSFFCTCPGLQTHGFVG